MVPAGPFGGRFVRTGGDSRAVWSVQCRPVRGVRPHTEPTKPGRGTGRAPSLAPSPNKPWRLPHLGSGGRGPRPGPRGVTGRIGRTGMEGGVVATARTVHPAAAGTPVRPGRVAGTRRGVSDPAPRPVRPRRVCGWGRPPAPAYPQPPLTLRELALAAGRRALRWVTWRHGPTRPHRPRGARAATRAALECRRRSTVRRRSRRRRGRY
jgi:hypothetical protein